MFLDQAVKSRRLANAEKGFWAEWGVWVLVGSIIVAAILYLVISWTLRAHRERISARSVEFNGASIDSAKLIHITLIDGEMQTLMKGDLFIAPLIEKDGYEFGGWFYDSARSKPYLNRRLTKDLTLYPKWIQRSR